MNIVLPNSTSLQEQLLSLLSDLPWLKLFSAVRRFAGRLLQGFASEGIYEVLDYECKLELKDHGGRDATIKKREKIRYLQDYVTTYQDQAWGDGEIFLNYTCFPGFPVDEYRLGANTFKLISLRNSRNKGDLDEFNIEWSMRNGFLKSTGFWSTSINHKTSNARVKLVFPKDRPPLNVSVRERNLQRTRVLEPESWHTLPDGRRMILWENANPRLYEDYILKWGW